MIEWYSYADGQYSCRKLYRTTTEKRKPCKIQQFKGMVIVSNVERYTESEEMMTGR